MSYILNEYSFTEILNAYAPVSSLLFDRKYFKLTTTGIVLRDNVEYGYIHIPINATKFKSIKAVDCLYQGNLYFSLQTVIGEFKKLNTDETEWISATTETWYPMEDFYKSTSYNYPNGVIIGLKFDSTTKLNSVNVLLDVDIDDYWYYIHTKFDSFIKSFRFVGRLVCDGVSTERVRDRYVIDIESITPVGGYNDVEIFSIRDSDSQEIFSEKNEQYAFVGRELADEVITVYFRYTCNTKINQGLDYVEIEKNPTLVVDNFTVTPSIEDSCWLPLYYLGEDGSKKGFKCQTQRGIKLDFNLIISATLYYDTLKIWETLFSHNFNDIGLTEIGNHFLVEIVNPTRETIPYNTEGGRVLYSRVSLVFPYPVNIQEESIVKQIDIKGNRFGFSSNEEDYGGESSYSRTITPPPFIEG